MPVLGVGVGPYPVVRRAIGTATNPTTSSTTYVAVDTSTDITIPAAVGDWLQITPSARWTADAVIAFLDAATIVSGSIVNYCSGRGSTGGGWPSWIGDDSSDRVALGAPMLYQVVSGDISGGNVLIRLVFRINSGVTAKSIAADANTKLTNQVLNLGAGT